MNVKLASMGNCQRNMPQVWVVAWSGVPAGEVWAAEVLGLSFDGRPVFLLLAKKHLTGEAVCEWIFKNVMFPFIESELAELRAVLDPEKLRSCRSPSSSPWTMKMHRPKPWSIGLRI